MEKCVLQSCLSNAWGGLEMVAFETAERLEAQGVRVITVVRPNSPLEQKLSACGFRILSLKPGSKYFSPRTIWRLRRELQSQHVTTILVQHLRDLWHLIPATVGLPSIQVVGLAHMFLGVRKKDLLHRWLYGRLRALIALTEIQRQNLLEHLPLTPQQVVILPNSVDVDRFRPERASLAIRQQLGGVPNVPLIGIVSRVDRQKGLLQAIAAAKHLRQMNQPFRLAIIGSETLGEESFLQELIHQIEANDLQSLVRFVGPRSDIEAVMASLDILLMAAPAETFGRVLIEAMASGVAVVAASGGGVANVIRANQTGLLVPPNDSKAMATALKTLCNDLSERQRLSQAGLEAARTTYNARNIDRQLARILEGVAP